MILIVSSAADPHARAVARALDERGEPVRVVDAGRLGQASHLALAVGRDDCSEWSADDVVTSMRDVKAIWCRRYIRPTLPPRLDLEERRFAWREWYDAFLGLLHAAAVPIINHPDCEQTAVKPKQLALAKRLGLTIPDTLITSDPVRAAAFVDAHDARVVHKTLTPPEGMFLPTRRWQPEDRAMLSRLPLAPTIFQEMVQASIEVRVTVVGNRVLAAAFRQRPELVDGRLDFEADYVPHSLPTSLVERLHALVRALGLVYSTIDLKLTDEGEYVFLELNPAGQYLYVEMLAGLPISAAVADTLVGAAREAR